MKIENFARLTRFVGKRKMAKPSQPQQPGVSAARDTPGISDPMDDPNGIAATKGQRNVLIRSPSAAIPAGSDGCFAFPGVSLVPR